MDRNDVDWKGYWPAVPTPFTREGQLDEPTLRKLLRFYLEAGLHGVLMNGTTGEWFSQSDSERRRVAEIAVEELGGKIPVVIGCTSFTSEHSAELGAHARSIGADGMLSTPPPYCKPTPAEILRYYQDLSDRVGMPIMVYNWPPGTNVDIGTDLMLRLAEIPCVVAVKDSTGDTAQFYRTLPAVVGRLRVFGNFMNRLGVAALREIGGDGFIGGGSIFAADDAEFWNALWRGDHDYCERHADRVSKLADQIWEPDWSGKFGAAQSQLKAIMMLLGQPGGHVRPPRLPVEEPDQVAGLRAALESVGLLKETAGVRT
jgi:1-pyrroline-4-hydroxy-2-carboxylate deaminase